MKKNYFIEESFDDDWLEFNDESCLIGVHWRSLDSLDTLMVNGLTSRNADVASNGDEVSEREVSILKNNAKKYD